MKLRTIDTHKVNPANEQVNIEVYDDAGVGGASHHYFISGFHTITNDAATPELRDETALHLLFQNGPIPEKGTNGVTHEILLAVVRDRLESFQLGFYATEENQRALDAVNEAMHWLHHRTLKRMARNVEGTLTV